MAIIVELEATGFTAGLGTVADMSRLEIPMILIEVVCSYATHHACIAAQLSERQTGIRSTSRQYAITGTHPRRAD